MFRVVSICHVSANFHVFDSIYYHGSIIVAISSQYSSICDFEKDHGNDLISIKQLLSSTFHSSDWPSSRIVISVSVCSGKEFSIIVLSTSVVCFLSSDRTFKQA